MKAIRIHHFGGPAVLPLTEARRAQEMSESHHAHGKIVLRIADEPAQGRKAA